jgi:TonB family protein
MRALALLLASVTSLTGCAVTTTIVREEAADDLECPEEELAVERMDDGMFRVTGCDVEARYSCSRAGLDDSLCTRRWIRAQLTEPASIVRAKAASLLACDPAEVEVLRRTSNAGYFKARGCGRRIEYECVSRGDCCAFMSPGVESLAVSERSLTPSASGGHPDKDGTLTKAAIREVIEDELDDVRDCYDPASAKGMSGVVVVEFEIGNDGRVRAAAVKQSSLEDAKVEACIVAAMRRRVFPEPASAGSVVVSRYPFVLQSHIQSAQACR